MPPVWVAVASVPRVSLQAVTWAARPGCLNVFVLQGSQNLLSKRKDNGTGTCITAICVADPDPYVFGPPGYGSGPDPYHQAKIVRKTLIPTVFLIRFDFLSLKNDVNVPSKSKKQNNFFLN
jgi:hypothetical protein